MRRQLQEQSGASPSSVDSYSDLSIKYAEVKAQYDNMTEASQLEIERLRLKVEQLSALEPPVGYKEQLQEYADRIEEADSVIASVRNENEIYRRRYEEDVVAAKQKADNAEREGLMLRGENNRLTMELNEQRKELAGKELEALQLQEIILTSENALKHVNGKQRETEQKLEAAMGEVTKLVGSKGELGNLVGELNGEIGSLHAALVEAQNQLSLVTSQFETSKSRLLLQSVELEATKSSLFEANKTISDLNTLISSTEQISRQRDERHQETISALSLQIKDMENRYESVVTELNTRKESRASTATVENSTRKKSKKTKIVISKLLAELMDLKTAYDETQKKFTNEVYEIKHQNEEKLIRVEKR